MKIIFILSFYFVILQADIYTQKLYEGLLGSIYQERPILVFADKETKNTLKNSAIFRIVDDCNSSDFIMGSDFISLPPECQDKPIFATTYRAYKKFKNSFGAFYWRKGRPQIHFNRSNIEKFSIILPYNLQRFEDE